MLRRSTTGFTEQGSTVSPFGSGGGGQLPVYTTVGRDALTGLSDGHGIWNSDNKRAEFWSGERWLLADGQSFIKPSSGATMNGHSINTDCVMRLLLNEATGTTLTDLSTAGNDLTLSSVTWSFSDRGDAPLFNGSSDSASGLDSALPAGSTTRTLAVRFKLTAPHTSGYQFLFNYGNASSGEQCGILFADGFGGYVFGQNFGDAVGSAIKADDGRWYSMAVRIVSGTWETFLDGVLQNIDTLTTNTVLDGTFYLGSQDGTQSFFNGKIDSLAIWDRALTDAEIMLWSNDPYIGVD